MMKAKYAIQARGGSFSREMDDTFVRIGTHEEELNHTATATISGYSPSHHKSSFREPFPDHYVAFIECGKDISTWNNSYKVNVGAYKKKYAIEPPKHLPELPKEFLELQKKFYKRAIKEILEEVSLAVLKKGRDPFKSMWTLEGVRIKELQHLNDDTRIMIVSKDKKFLPLKNTVKEIKEED